LDKSNVYLIVFENAVEKDLIEKGINQKLTKDHEKYKLPEYANKTDIDLLREKDENFRNFIRKILLQLFIRSNPLINRNLILQKIQ